MVVPILSQFIVDGVAVGIDLLKVKLGYKAFMSLINDSCDDLTDMGAIPIKEQMVQIVYPLGTQPGNIQYLNMQSDSVKEQINPDNKFWETRASELKDLYTGQFSWAKSWNLSPRISGQDIKYESELHLLNNFMRNGNLKVQIFYKVLEIFQDLGSLIIFT